MSLFITNNVLEDRRALLTLLDILPCYLEKYTLLILSCLCCPALVKTTLCQASHKVLQNDSSGFLNRWSPRKKNWTDRRFMTLNYIKATPANIMSKKRKKENQKKKKKGGCRGKRTVHFRQFKKILYKTLFFLSMN